MGRTARACSDTWCLCSYGPFEVRVMQQVFKQVPEAFPCGAGADPPLTLIYSATSMQPLRGCYLQFPQRKSGAGRILQRWLKSITPWTKTKRDRAWASEKVYWYEYEWGSAPLCYHLFRHFDYCTSFYNTFTFCMPGHRQARVSLNYVQVYQERCYDLLQPASTKPLRVRGLLRSVTNTWHYVTNDNICVNTSLVCFMYHSHYVTLCVIDYDRF